MGKGGRFGKYGEHKRFQRLRQGRERAIKMAKDFQTRETAPELLRRKGKRESRSNKAGTIGESPAE
ncbi:MAG: hypothetical protein HY882_06335 [Deltaproteobacteria bacterium]|nr:hypothetical protein [Deltaproteobacteria bacterium]